MYITVPGAHLEFMEARRRHRIAWNCRYRWHEPWRFWKWNPGLLEEQSHLSSPPYDFIFNRSTYLLSRHFWAQCEEVFNITPAVIISWVCFFSPWIAYPIYSQLPFSPLNIECWNNKEPLRSCATCLIWLDANKRMCCFSFGVLFVCLFVLLFVFGCITTPGSPPLGWDEQDGSWRSEVVHCFIYT